jgi:hypothetical protein
MNFQKYIFNLNKGSAGQDLPESSMPQVSKLPQTLDAPVAPANIKVGFKNCRGLALDQIRKMSYDKDISKL